MFPAPMMLTCMTASFSLTCMNFPFQVVQI
jgi:hypothetical protein